MKWEFEDIVEYLCNDYCLHYRNRIKFLDNDNQVDSDYEAAQMDYIFELLKSITGCTTEELGDRLQDQLDGVFVFDPLDNPELLKPYEGQSFYSAEDIYYSDYESFIATFDKEDADIILQEVMSLDDYNKEVYIPKGTKMTLVNSGNNSSNGWPEFDIHGYTFDFGGSPFKLKPIRR